MNFSMASNEGIGNFFKGDDSYIPTSELMYIHSHPLVSPNFLVEIELLVKEVADIITSKNITGSILSQLSDIVISIGSALPTISESNAESILKDLRKLYRLCNEVKSTFN